MSYRLALLIAILGFLFLVGFSTAAGLSMWVAVAFFVIYMMISIAVTRMRVTVDKGSIFKDSATSTEIILQTAQRLVNTNKKAASHTSRRRS